MSDDKSSVLDVVEEAIRRLESLYDPEAEQRRVADAAREAAGSLTAPAWWKAARARFDQGEPEPLPRRRRMS